jgi:Concanavalin A-like lectin/glucanases superfamily
MECEVFEMSLYASAVLTDQPQAYYRLDDLSGGSANDFSANNYDGTVYGSIGYSMPGALKNDPDSSMLFDGSSAYISLPSGLTQGSVGSWECWFMLSQAVFSTYPRLIANDSVGNTKTGVELGIYANASGLFANLGYSTNSSTISYNTTLTSGTWYHFVITYNGTTAILYLNGSNVAQITISHNLTAGSNNYNIGRNPYYSGDYFPGLLDEVAIYSYALSPSQVGKHYTIGSTIVGSNTQYDLSVYKEQMVLVYDYNGNFVDCVRDAPILSGFKESINAVTSSLKVQLPRKFEQIDLPGETNAHGIMQQGYVWKYYLFGPGLPSSGLLRYSGQVDEYVPQINENGEETIAVTLTPQGSAIADSGLGATVTFGTANNPSTYVDPLAQFDYWFNTTDPVTGNTYCYPLTLDPNNPTSSGVATQFSYTNQNIKSMLDNTILMLPANYFYRTNPDNTVTRNQTPLTAQHVLQVGVHIVNPQYSQSWIQTKTAVFFLGGTDPTTVTTANPNGNPITAIARGADMTTIGERLYLHNESRVTDQATANALAQGDLAYYDQPMLRTKIRVPDFRGPNPSIGYDIESIKVGDSIQIQDNTYNGASTKWDNSTWGNGIWDQSPGPALDVVGIITSLNYGFYYIDIEIGLPQPNLARAVSQVQQKLQDFTLL